MGQYSIKDIETLSGVKAHTLRIWEQRYDFLKPNRTDTNIRYYNDEQLKLILNISILHRSGMRISKIACLPNDELCQEVKRLSEVSGEPHASMDALIHAMIDFDEARFEKTVSCAITKHGFINAFSKLIFPLLQRTGVLWSTGVIKPAQEHFMSNLVKRKLMAAIDGQFVRKTPDSRKFVLFLPEGENHELVLLFSEYVLREHNHDVTYLGNSVPFDDIHFILETFAPDCLLSYITIPLQEMSLQAYVNHLAEAFPRQRILLGGTQFTQQYVTLPDNVSVVCCISELLQVTKKISSSI